MRHVCSLLVGIALLSIAPSPVYSQGGSTDLSITTYQFVSEVRYSRTQWFVTYTADLRNQGAARSGVTATLTSLVPTVQVVMGQNVLHFAPVPANSTVHSVDTFTILVDRSVTFDLASLSWTFLNPVANAGANQSAHVGSTVILDGSGSLNPSGAGTLTYHWSLDAKPGASHTSLVNPNSPMCSLPVDASGTYILSLTVDNGLASDKAVVSVSTVNTPPVANAGLSQTVALNSTVTVNGSGSSDVDGDPLTFQWTLISYPVDSAALLSNPRAMSPTFVVDRPGTYIAQLVVNDGVANSAAATVRITTANTPPVANAGPSQRVAIGALVQLNGAGSTDVDGDVLSYHWMLITAPPGSAARLSNPAAVNPTFTADLAGSYVAQLIVNDGKVDSPPSAVSIDTNVVQAPTANVGPNQTVVHGTIVNLAGSCTDPQQLPCTAKWAFTTRPPGSTAALSAVDVMNPSFVADLTGTYVAQLIVNNGSLNSPAVTVTITTTNTTPVADAGTNRNVFTGAVVALDGSKSSDSDHDPLTYSWSFLSKPSGSSTTLQAANTPTPSFFADVAGTYVAQLIVNDGLTNSNPATVTITASTMGIILGPSSLDLFNSPVTLTITLSAPAAAGGVPVAFSGFDTHIISVPSGVVIPANSTGVNVTITPLAPGATNLTVTATGYQPATAPVTVTTPHITLSSTLTAVGIGRSVPATITLSAPAPPSGTTVTLSAPALVGLAPTSVVIPAGQTTGTFNVSGVTEGSATITAGSSGYTGGSLTLLVVKLGSILLPANLVVSPGQAATLDVRLAVAAPADGVTISLVSSDPSVLTVPPSVFIAQGATTPSTAVTVTGVAFGSATVTASSPGLTGDAQTVKVGASLSFSAQTLSVGAGGVRNINLLLSAPAPAGGLTVVLNSSNTAAATVPTTANIAANATSASIPVTGVAAGNSTVTASSNAPNVTGATLSVTVQVAGSISVPSGTPLAAGQSAAFPIALSSPAPQGGLVVTLSSSDAARVSISPATLTIPQGALTPDAQPQVTGASFGVVTISASAVGYTGATGTVTSTAALSIGPSPVTLTGAESRTLTVTLSVPAPADTVINLTASPSGIVTIPASVTIARNATTAAATVVGAGVGTATVTAAPATASNVSSGTDGITVQNVGALQLTFSGGVALGQTASIPLSLAAPAPAGGVTITLTSSNPSKLSVTPSTYTVAAGQTVATPSAQLLGKDLGSADITATAPFYSSAVKTIPVTATISLAPGTVSLSASDNTTLTLTLSGPAPAGGMTFSVASSAPTIANVSGPSVTIAEAHTTATFTVSGVAPGTAVVRVSAPNVTDATANITVTPAIDIIMPATLAVAPGDLVPLSIKLAKTYTTPVFLVLTTSDPGKASVTPTTVTVPAGQTSPQNVVQVSGVASGSATISATASGMNLAPASTSVTVGFAVTLSPSPVIMSGNGTTSTLNILLSGPAPAGGLDFTITSSNTGVVTAPPSVFLSATSSSTGIRLTSVAPGTSVIHVNAPGIPEATVNVTVAAPGSVSMSGPASIGLNQAANLTVTLATPAPAAGVTVEFSTSNASKVALSQTTVNIPAGAVTPAVAPQIVGANVGSAVITALAPGYTAPTPLTVNVTAAVTWVTQTATITGLGNQAQLTLRLSATAPNDGLVINLSSSNTGVATVPSTASFFWDGSNAPTITIPVTSVAAGTTLIHASGVNIPDVTATVTVIGPVSITTASLPGAAAGAPYTATLVAAGGLTPYTWSATGLPSGITIDGATGVLSGTPAAAGTSTIHVTVTDSASPTHQSVSKDLSLTIGSGMTIGTASLPAATAGAAYSAPLSVVGGTGPYTWTATGLPAPLTINASDGTISGVPTAAASVSVRVTVTDSTTPAHLTTFKDFTLTIAAGLNITTASLPQGSVGVLYSAPLAANGGTPSYTWSATGLPAGLSIDPATGTISGTPTGAAGNSTVNVTVTDSLTPTHRTASASFTLTIASGLSITTTALTNASPGVPYSMTLTAASGNPPYTWSATGLPDGLSISPAGVISGTPTTAGSSTVNLSVTDSSTPTRQSASKQLPLSVALRLTLSPSDSTIRGFGNQTLITLQLSAPAPAGGIEFTATSSNPAVATVGSFVPMSGGSSSVSVRVTSVAAGTAVIHVSAPGIAEATANVTVLPPGSVNLTGPPTVGLSTAGTLNVSLSVPAPAGGVTVQLTSSDTTKIQLLTPSVTIAEGKTAPDVQPEMTGINVGSAAITATATGYTASAPLTININATIRWEAPTATIAGLNNQVLVTLRLLASAPVDQRTGVPVNLTSSDPSVATIQPTAIFIWDGSNAPGSLIPVTSVGPGTTILHASGVNIPEVTMTVTVVGPVTVTTPTLASGIAGAPYSATLGAAGGTGPYSWAATGLPTGLGISAGGVISGTPAAAGSGPVTVTVTDSSSPTHQTASKTFTLTVAAGVGITTASLPGGVTSTAYSAPLLTAAGGTGPYTWTASGLPAGLSISTGGAITGTPTTAGSSTASITATDSTPGTHLTASKQFVIVVVQALSITTPTLPSGNAAVAYSATVAATGGTTPYTWSAVGLPANLSINSATGVISGVPAAAGTSTVTINITDSSSPQLSASKQLQLVIGSGVSITTPSLPDGLATSAYSAPLAATGGVTPYSWSANGLPTGLTINTSTGTISGTPAAAGTSTVTVTVADATTPTHLSGSRTYNLTVGPALSITTAALPGGLATSAYSATVAATGGTLTYTWSATGLPAGLSINPANGVISGTPTTAAVGTANVVVTVVDSTPVTHQSASKTLTLAIGAAVSITTPSLPGGVVGATYSATLGATGGTSGYSWAATNLPAGLSINASTGVISGTPTTAGSPTVNVTVTDSTAPTPQTATKAFTIAISSVFAITTTALTDGVATSDYSFTVTATGGTTPFTWSATGLPAGLGINAASGLISGTPTTAGASTVTISVADATTPTPRTASKQLTLTVGPALSITTTSLPGGLVTTPYSKTVTATGGTSGYTWAATGLPNGLTMNAATGVISGTPTAAVNASVTITVTDSTLPTHQSVSKTLPLTIGAAVSITTASLPAGTAGAAYSATVSAAGGTGPYTWSATGLPASLAMSSTGTISGTPAAAGSSTVSVTVTDSTSPTHQTATLQYTLVINPGVSITTTSLTDGLATTAYSLTVAATGGATPYTWSATGLPAGLGITTAGVISGTPTTAGTSIVTLTVSDSSTPTARSDSKQLNLTIRPAVSVTVATLPPGFTTFAYSSSVSATGGTPSYTWSATGLPAGLSINSATGAITGTPTTTGTSNAVVTVTDSTTPIHQTASRTFPITISQGLTIATASLPDAYTGFAYSTAVTATGGTTPYSWTATGLPAGLSISSSTGIISGTATAAGTATVTVMATDSTAPALVVSKELTLNVKAGLAITTASLPSRPAGSAYSATLAATGGTQPYSWSANNLPTGFALSTAGVLTGSPSSPSTTTVDVTVTDVSSPAHLSVTKQFTLTVTPQLAITTSVLPAGPASSPYSATVVATGGTTAYTWSATGLPSPLVMNATTGVISGTPTASFSGTVTITVIDSTAPTPQTATVQLTLTISPKLAITTASLPSNPAGSPYTATLAASGGTGAYTWTATGLPTGFTLDPNGTLSGNPAAPLSTNITVTVTDTTPGTHQTDQKTFTLTITNALSITTATLPAALVNTAYSSIVAAAGGTKPYNWTATGLPSGFAINATTGEISGTAATASTNTVVVTAKDATSPTNQSVSKTFTLTISNAPTITTATLPSGQPFVAYGPVTMTATGGKAPYSWSSTDISSAGLAIDGTGVISGTPRNAGNFTVHITLTDSSTPEQTVSKTFTISIVSPPLSLVTTSLPAGTVNVPYSFTPQASGGTGLYNWTATGLPNGLQIVNTTGVISGTPTTPNSNSVTLTVTDGSSQTASRTMNLVISNVPPGGTIGVSNANVGQNLQTQITITLNPPPAAAVSLTITSNNPSVLLGSADVAGSTQLTTNVTAGTTTLSTYVKGLASTGSAQITASILGYADGIGTVTLFPAGFAVSSPEGIGAAYTTFQGAKSTLTVFPSRLDTQFRFAEAQQIRGTYSVSVPFSNDVPNTGSVSPSALTFTGGMTSGTFDFTASIATTGTTTLRAGAPFPFATLASGASVGVTIQQSGILPCDANLAVGKNLQRNTCLQLTSTTLSPVTITIQSGDPARLKFSTLGGTPADSITVLVPANQKFTSDFSVHAYDSVGTVNYTVSASGFGSNTLGVSLSPSGFAIFSPFGLGSDFNISLGSPDATLGIFTARLDAAGNVQEQQAVAAGVTVSVAVASSATGVGTIVTSPLSIPAGGFSASTNFHPVSAGTTTITASAPGWTSGSVHATAQAPTLVLGGGLTVGQFLQGTDTVILPVRAPAGGLHVTIQSNSAQLKLSTDPTKAGTSSIGIDIAAGDNSAPFYLQALGTSGTVTYTASAPGYSAATASLDMAPSGIVIQCAPCTISSTGAPQNLIISAALLSASGAPITPQALAGGAALSVVLNNSNRAAGSIPGTALLNPGVAQTTVPFTPGTAGTSTTVSVTQPSGWGIPISPTSLTQVLISVQ